MHLVLFGSGAMACLFGARLAPLAEVTLVGSWPAGLTALREHGIILEEAERTSSVRVGVATLGQPVPPADMVLVFVKAWQTALVASHIAPTLKPGGQVLTLQNGLGNVETLAKEIGATRAWAGITTQGATLVGPGQVREGGRGLTTLPNTPVLAQLSELFTAAGFEISQSPLANLQSLIWGKLVVNCGINALTALLRIPNGELLRRTSIAPLMAQAATECAAVAQAQGIPLPFADPVAQVQAVATRTSRNHSSMLQDILRGSLTEIDAINGAVMRLGAQCGVPTPVNELLWRLVKALGM